MSRFTFSANLPPVLVTNKSGTITKELYEGTYPNISSQITDVYSIAVPAIYSVYLYDTFGAVGNISKYIDNGGQYNNLGTIASMKIIKTKDWDKFKVDCCSSNLDSITQDQCQNLWGELSNKVCDVIMQPYCNVHTEDKACSCYNVPVLSINKTVNSAFTARPDCYYDKCNIHGYKPSAIAHKECTPLTICSQDLNTSGNENVISNNIQTINCGMDTSGNNPVIGDASIDEKVAVLKSKDGTDESEQPTVVDNSKSLTSNKSLLIILVLILVIVSIVYSGMTSRFFGGVPNEETIIGGEYETEAVPPSEFE